ncbi:MAG: hypothetical protein ACRELA_03315 [Candidatus Rokuibacteriota bacterium]
MGRSWGWALVVWTVVAAPAGVAEARTAEVHLVVRSDLQRLQPSAPPDEPMEPAPSLQQKVREIVTAHPAFRDVTLKVVVSEGAPNPRVPADFMRLVEQGIDEVVVVNLRYQLRLDNFRATGVAGIGGHIAVYSVVGRRQVVSRGIAVTVRYPGDVSKETVVQAELAARARGAPIPIEQVELSLLDAAVKQRLERELGSALGIYHPPSLPQASKRAIEESMERLVRFLAQSPDRRGEAVQVSEQYLVRYADSPHREDVATRLRTLRQPGGTDPRLETERQRERVANRVKESVTASQLAGLIEQLTGSVVEVRAFTLWQESATVWMRGDDRRQDFVVEQVPSRLWALEADPPALYVLVLGRRPDPRFVDTRIPVLRWVGCPKTACPPGP